MRCHDWNARLAKVVSDARHRSFRYGAFDCALFCADCVEAMTGTDYARELRGYQSRAEAYEIVAGYGSLESMVSSLLKQEPVHPSHARVGDVVIAMVPSAAGEAGETLGVCLGARCAFSAGTGLAYYPRSRARLAWRID